MIEFEKEYTRDFSLIQAQVYLYSLERLSIEAGWGVPPEPTYLGHTKNGVIEYWANANGLQWLANQLLSENTGSKSFFEKHTHEYERIARELQLFWEQGIADSLEQLQHAIQLCAEGCIGWNVMYFTGLDERNPAELRERAMKLRELDTLGASSNSFIVQSLANLYPQLASLSKRVLSEEIDPPPENDELGSRDSDFIIVKNGSMSECGRMSLNEFKNKYGGVLFHENRHDTRKNVLHGSIAHKGFVRGTVRRITKLTELARVADGDILITHMTTPEYVPAMHKAAAFVTDEGGVMCHAAIFAREFKKPCVIGTRTATQIFKDGDLVEVDAENGIVRKL